LHEPERFLREIFRQTNAKSVMLFGLGNIHTPQAEAVINYLESLPLKKRARRG
jgi:hypothetical protein